MQIFHNAFEFRYFNSGGKGGQHGNRSLNAVEVKLRQYISNELGITPQSATSSGFKSQKRNKSYALRVLRCRIMAAVRQLDRRDRFAAGSERVRNYHEPNDRVTDAAGSYSYRLTVGKSDLSTVIEALASRCAERRLTW